MGWWHWGQSCPVGCLSSMGKGQALVLQHTVFAVGGSHISRRREELGLKGESRTKCELVL